MERYTTTKQIWPKLFKIGTSLGKQRAQLNRQSPLPLGVAQERQSRKEKQMTSLKLHLKMNINISESEMRLKVLDGQKKWLTMSMWNSYKLSCGVCWKWRLRHTCNHEQTSNNRSVGSILCSAYSVCNENWHSDQKIN